MQAEVHAEVLRFKEMNQRKENRSTTTLERIAYARCFVEISAHAPFKKYVWLEMKGEEKSKIDVEYEWVPPTCSKCKCFGHLNYQCPTKEMWRPKEPLNTVIPPISVVSDSKFCDDGDAKKHNPGQCNGNPMYQVSDHAVPEICGHIHLH